MGPMSRNVGRLLETYAAYNPRRAKYLFPNVRRFYKHPLQPSAWLTHLSRHISAKLAHIGARLSCLITRRVPGALYHLCVGGSNASLLVNTSLPQLADRHCAKPSNPTCTPSKQSGCSTREGFQLQRWPYACVTLAAPPPPPPPSRYRRSLPTWSGAR